MPNTLLAGSARVDITPPLSIPHLAYVPRQGKFKDVHDKKSPRKPPLSSVRMNWDLQIFRYYGII
ncbi:MAG: hypothetical protein ACE5PV_23520 [Candidatus Poribacteria bacterium]